MKQSNEHKLSFLGIGFVVVAVLIAAAFFFVGTADRYETQAPVQRDQFAN